MYHSDRIIRHLEVAGGALSEANALTAKSGSDSIPLGEAVRLINRMTADLRRAIVKIQQGALIEEATREATASWREDVEEVA